MIKQILKIIWNQRRSNGWIFAELLVVTAILWVMTDSLLVDQYTYHSPLGFDISNTYKVQLSFLTEDSPGYVDKSELTTRKGEDILRLADNLRQAPEVEQVSIGCVSSPYTNNNMWEPMMRADADSATKTNSYQNSFVTPEYFEVLRMTDTSGNPLRIQPDAQTEVVISRDLETKLFDAQQATGQKIKRSFYTTQAQTVAAVCSPVRQNEYVKSTPFFYSVESAARMIDVLEEWPPAAVDCLVRMRSGFPPENTDAFLQGMSDRLTVNNVYVSSIIPLAEMRGDILKSRQDNMKKKSALVGFMLVNVFFGIIGTFWLRTQSRRGEMGLRIALGSNRSQLSRLMNLEGLCLLALTIPFLLIFISNMLYMDMPDTNRLPYTWWRFALTFGSSYLLMGGMICIGIWFPVQRILGMEPAEALHYE